MPNLTISQALAQADLLVDRPTIDKAIASIADAIARDYEGEVPLFLSIMHGALPFAGQLALELGARGQDVQFDYLHATRYRGETTGGDLVWKHKPATSRFGRRVLRVTTSSMRATPCRACAPGAWNRAPPTCASRR